MRKNKHADTTVDVLPLIAQRWSPVLFTNELIYEDDISKIFEAARWAPSSRNEQPWRFIYANRGSDLFMQMIDCLMPANQEWAKNAALLVLVLSEKYSSYDGKKMVHNMYDTGAASMQMQLQAISMGIYSHSMGGYDLAKTKHTFNIPDNFEIAAYVAYGYLDLASSKPEHLVARDSALRERKPVAEFVFNTGF